MDIQWILSTYKNNNNNSKEEKKFVNGIFH